MKNQNEIKAVNGAMNRNGRAMRYAHWGIKPSLFPAELPTPKELATLAATLSRAPNDDQKKLCSSALQLWNTSAEALDLQRKCNQDFAEMVEADKKEKGTMPDAIHFPMKQDAAWKYYWPKKDTAERAALFKKFLAHLLLVEHIRGGGDRDWKPTKAAIDARFTVERSKPMAEHEFSNGRFAVMKWYERHISAMRSNAGKKKPKKSLEG